MQDIVNFRDFGGMPSRFGGRVRHDRLYRSGAPHRASPAELDRLLGFSFALIGDLRYRGERDQEPSPWPADHAVNVLVHDGGPDLEAPHMAPLRAGTLNEAISDRLYEQLYRELPFDPHYQPLLRRLLTRLPDADGRVLVHCTAGKDRTGMVVALIQHALGVPRDAIIADFMRSSREPGLMAMAPALVETVRTHHGWALPLPLAEHLLDVRPSYLTAFLDEIEDRAGSLDAYLDATGLDAAGRERLRDRLLEQ
ncbi:tyrosine-protein phosphatase [Flavisphingomonas formosensis]|uniref:tyrosine-protein phosphatase n=1 Tax=Flavisphingomonas formosensis TaxID=861534 RepID=UPI0012F87436|nr:tyrosine-protein phosphatase [Sphingomonas formosensis]